MAIGRVPGPALLANLDRQGTDLSFTTLGNTLVKMDFTNFRLGVGNTSPTETLTVNGNTIVYNGTLTAENFYLDGGLFDAGGMELTNLGDPVSGQDAVTLAYLESFVSSATLDYGNVIPLGEPDDSDLVTNGAYLYWDTNYNVTTAIDDLNEVVENIRNNTFVKSVDFTADQTVGGAGLVVTLTITAIGNANRYTINWGDGSTTTATTDSTPTHTYSTNVGSPFDVTVTAFNNSGAGTGSTVTTTKANYITIYTADPVVSFAAYAASSGGAPITYWDDGDTVYFENTTTNTSGATVQYTWDWGDSQADDVISSDASAGGVGGGRIAHTFDTATEQEQQFTVTLTLDSHSTAQPSAIPDSDTNTYEVYDTHTPSLTASGTTGINEEGTSGLPITFTNTTESTIGSYSTYGIQYIWQWGDGTSNVTVNTGSGSSGDDGQNISHTFALSSSNQANGVAVDYTGYLYVTSNHTSSPFQSSSFSVHVEPDVRAIISGTAVTVSDKTGDNQYDIYDYTTYDGINLANVAVTNTSQNADDYEYDWADGSTNDTVTEDGSSPGSLGAPIYHDFAGQSTGNYTLTFDANGTPDITAQTDQDTSITFTLNANPSAPSALNTFSLTLADSYQGTSPKLCAGAQDESASSPLSAGDALTTTTARRYTSGTIDTNTINNAYNCATVTLTAFINGADSGNKTFTATLNETGTFTSLVVSQQGDAHDTISSSTYPTGFYQTFDAKITQALTSYEYGINDERLSHSTTGVTNYVSVVYDNVSSAPTVASAGTAVEGTGGTKRYVSGIPYYNSGSPTVILTGVQVDDLTGQAYSDVSNPVEVDNGTNQEGTSSAGTVNTDYSYTDIDGSVTMLTGGIPNANVGVASSYTLGNLTVPITSSTVRTVDRVQVRARNCNGTSSYVENATNIQVHKSAQSGISEIAIAVSDSLGNGTYTDDGLRVTDFLADTTDTPSYSGATNFYTNAPYSESSDPGVEGTKEATVRLGVLKYDVTDYSSGYLPVGPDRSSDTGTQYFTFAFRRQVVANFDLNITSSTGVSGVWIAAPGTTIDSASSLNGWLDASTTYGGSGVPGANTGSGGNGSNGCAFTSGDRIQTGTSLSGGYTMTLGSENMTNATGNVVLVRIALQSGESVTALSVGVAS